jgi:hypothetical protein
MEFNPNFTYMLQSATVDDVIKITLSLRFPLYARNQVSHPYETTVKIILFYILIFMFLCLFFGQQTRI